MRLKIRFVKFKNMLTMQILEQEGIEKGGTFVKVDLAPGIEENCIYLRGSVEAGDNLVVSIPTEDFVASRNKYVKEISNFLGIQENKFPCLCKVWDNEDGEKYLRFVLGVYYDHPVSKRFCAISNIERRPNDMLEAIINNGTRLWKHAEPITGLTVSEDSIFEWIK